VFDEQPVGTLASIPIAFHSHDHEAAMQTLSLQGEFQFAFFELFLR
jgi:hypothetical protein